MVNDRMKLYCTTLNKKLKNNSSPENVISCIKQVLKYNNIVIPNVTDMFKFILWTHVENVPNSCNHF